LDHKNNVLNIEQNVLLGCPIRKCSLCFESFSYFFWSVCSSNEIFMNFF